VEKLVNETKFIERYQRNESAREDISVMVKTITSSKEKERVRIKERMLMTSTISSWVFYFSEHKKNNVIPQS